jgi:chromosome segregation ATPase
MGKIDWEKAGELFIKRRPESKGPDSKLIDAIEDVMPHIENPDFSPEKKRKKVLHILESHKIKLEDLTDGEGKMRSAFEKKVEGGKEKIATLEKQIESSQKELSDLKKKLNDDEKNLKDIDRQVEKIRELFEDSGDS